MHFSHCFAFFWIIFVYSKAQSCEFLYSLFSRYCRSRGSHSQLAFSSGSHVPDTPDIPKEPVFPKPPLRSPSGFIALGDSYSAGIGTGVNGTENDCRRGLNAYPELLRKDWQRLRGSDPTFQFLSCTGSTINDVLSGGSQSQIDNLNATLSTDFALLSVGGNDLGFFEIMNSCIFRFYSFYSGTCESALEKSQQALKSPEFEHRLGIGIMEILDKVQWEKNPGFTIFVTGYAKFFNAETDECDSSSFGMWWRGPKLRKILRRQMNRMVEDVNEKIKQSIENINSRFTALRVYFVDYDSAFEGHRFCEPAVVEPDYGRNETWFFLVGGLDNDDMAQNLPEAANSRLLPTSPLLDVNICEHVTEMRGDWGEKAICMMAKAADMDPTLRTASGGLVNATSMWYVPTYYGKTFHPRTQGHIAIRDRIYQLWSTLQGTETEPS